MVLFRRLAAPDRSRVAGVSRVIAVERGDRIFTEGDVADSFLSIVDGRVKVFKSTPAGKELILEIRLREYLRDSRLGEHLGLRRNRRALDVHFLIAIHTGSCRNQVTDDDVLL